MVRTPIDSLEELLENPSYQIMVTQDTSHESYFKEASPTKDPVAATIWQQMIKGNEKAYTSNASTAHDIIVNDDKRIYFSQELSVETTMRSYPCDIVASKSSYLHGYVRFHFPCFLSVVKS